MKEVLEKFYTAFSEKDAETMASCYHEHIFFKDPAFGVLRGEDAKDMWRMLCQNGGTDTIITYTEPIADQTKGLVKWEARYIFSKTKRKVHNVVLGKFKFKDGMIIEHIDTFNLHTWAKQAMGWKGYLLGNTRFFKKQLQKTTKGALRKFQNS